MQVLSIGQRFGDCFILRQFWITGTIAAKLVLTDFHSLDAFGCFLNADLAACERSTREIILSDLCESWFSSARATEAMMRGTENDSAFFSAVRSMYFVEAVYEVAMFGNLANPWLAVSQDGVALLNFSKLKYARCAGSCAVGCSFHDCASWNQSAALGEVASLQFKTSLASSSLQRNVPRPSVDVDTCILGDDTFNRLVPMEHAEQVVQQMCVLQCYISIYFYASKTGLPYMVVAQLEPATLETCRDVLVKRIRATVSWAHELNVEAPLFACSETKRKLEPGLGV